MFALYQRPKFLPICQQEVFLLWLDGAFIFTAKPSDNSIFTVDQRSHRSLQEVDSSTY